MNLRSAVTKINKRNMLLVFPVNNRKDIASLWNEFFPRKKMRWEWDESGDNSVAELWHLRERLSTSNQVVYSKWFRNRATLISQSTFTALLKALNPQLPHVSGLSFEAREVLDFLEEDSPLSTKQLKKIADLTGRENEARYQRALKELWARGLIVAYGEVDEGAFPSLAIGATQLIFEDLWNDAVKLSHDRAQTQIQSDLAEHESFLKYFNQLVKQAALAANVEDASDSE